MNILQKHQANLQRLRTKIKSVCAGAMFMGALLCAENVQAQNLIFDNVQVNPFGLTTIPIGLVSSPTFADLDGDGDLDMMSGNFDSDTYLGSFFYHENTGGATAPSFAAPQTNPFGLASLNYLSTPRFVDLDNDGDMDLVAGNFYGEFNYYENTGSTLAPAFGAAQTNPFSLSSTSGFVNVFDFVDLDGDGDLDLLAGDISGVWSYFANTGTSAAPTFAAAQAAPFGLTPPTSSGSSDIRLSFIDADGDGDQDILRGGYDSLFYYRQNTGTSTAPAFAAEVINPFGLDTLPSLLLYPVFADLDADGDMDLLAGAYDGSFYYYQNNACLLNPTIAANMDTLRATANATATYQWLNCATNMPVAGQASATFVPNLSGNFAVIATNNGCVDTSACFNFIYSAIDKNAENQTLIFPNPAQDIITVQTAQAWQNATIRLVNLNGQVISQQQNVNENQISLDLKNLPKAIYIVEIEAANGVSRHKISKQ